MHIMPNYGNMLKFKMAALKPEIYNSAYIQDTCKIPTATPYMFSRSRNSTKLFSLLHDAIWSGKSKIAAHKQEYLYLSLTAIYMFPFYMNPMKLFSILRDVSGSQKSKMAAHKNQVYSFFSLY